jgi:hypothetical protein
MVQRLLKQRIVTADTKMARRKLELNHGLNREFYFPAIWHKSYKVFIYCIYSFIIHSYNSYNCSVFCLVEYMQ